MKKENIDKNIGAFDDEMISKLLDGKLTLEEEQQLISKIDDDEMLGDALEGLDQYSSLMDAKKQAHNLNKKLKEQLQSKKQIKKLHPLSMSTIIWITLILIIVLAFVGFYLIKIKGL